MQNKCGAELLQCTQHLAIKSLKDQCLSHKNQSFKKPNAQLIYFVSHKFKFWDEIKQMKLTQHVQNIFPTLKTSPQKGIRIQTKPKTGEKHFHAQARSFAMIHWCFPYDVNYCAGFQSFLSLFKFLSLFWSLILYGNETF